MRGIRTDLAFLWQMLRTWQRRRWRLWHAEKHRDMLLGTEQGGCDDPLHPGDNGESPHPKASQWQRAQAQEGFSRWAPAWASCPDPVGSTSLLWPPRHSPGGQFRAESLDLPLAASKSVTPPPDPRAGLSLGSHMAKSFNVCLSSTVQGTDSAS